MTTKIRAHFIGAPEFFHLDLLCRVINEAFGEYGYGTYLVGSSLHRRDFRDVDVRFIMADAEFDRLFPEVAGASAGCWSRCSAWSLICGAVSEWLAKRSGLPIDFQIQRMTEANAEFNEPRNALGVFRTRSTKELTRIEEPDERLKSTTRQSRV